MKVSALLVLVAAAAAAAMLGTFLIGRGSSPKTGSVREDTRIGDQSLGMLIPEGKVIWTPKKNPNGTSETADLPPNDPRIQQFADFPVLIPSYLPKDCHVEKVTVTLDEETRKRLVQISIQGAANGLISEFRLKKKDPNYPKGLNLTTVRQPNGDSFRNLQSNVNGVGVSVACELALPDSEITKVYYSLKPL
jgi:hypothetical protein